MSLQENKNYQPTIIIIGAGAAGLCAAQRLVQNGFKQVTLLEASRRIGGRILTVPFGAKPDDIIELGANWIHGGMLANPVYTTAIQNNLLNSNIHKLNRRVGLFYTSSGKIIEPELAFKAFDIFMKVDTEASNKKNLLIDLTMKDFLAKRLQEEVMAFTKEEQEQMQQVFNCMCNFLVFHIGDSLDRISVKEYGQYQELPCGDVKLPKGFLKIFECVARNLPQETLQFNKKVTNINWNSLDNKLHVKCKDNYSVFADHVIITVSLGCLKSSHLDLFTPVLPLAKQDAIHNLGFGRVNKVFLYFKNPFWIKGFESIHLAWQNDELRISDKSDWVKSIFAFDEVLNNSNVLVAWIAGSGAEIMEQLSDDQIIIDCTRLLRQFTGNPLLPEPACVLHSNWCTNSLIQGSYSYVPVNCHHENILILADPLPSSDAPQLLFAGEATHSHYFSTVHGAMLSGIREADRLIKLYKAKHSKL